MKCSKCGFENQENNKYCVSCGAVLEEKVEKSFCYNCGSENPVDSKYCVSCGQSLYNGGSTINAPIVRPYVNDSSALGLGIASLAVSIVCCCLIFVGQIVSIVLGSISIKRALTNKSNKNTVGLVLSIIGICISLYMIISFIYSIAIGEFQQAFQEGFNSVQGGQQMIKAFFN